MSQMATEPPAPRGRQNVFTRRIGPLPMWIWLVIAAVIVIGWAWYRNRQQAGATTTPSDTTGTSQVPQFVNQTYTTVQPPTVPVTVSQKMQESDEDEDETERGKRHRKKPVNRRHPTHPKPHRPGTTPERPPRPVEFSGGPGRFMPPRRAA